MRWVSRAGVAILAAAVAACGSVPRGVEQRPNILLITADSLRADRIDWSGGRTPALAALARRGTRFTRAYTVTPWTAPSLVSIFTGLYPPTHGVENRDDSTPKALPTLPRLLGARGFTLRNYGFFTAVSYFRNLGLPEQAVTGAEFGGAQALAEWLPSAPEPFFAWIHFVEPHLPYGAGGYEAAEAKVKGSSGLERAQVSATVPLGAGYAFAPGDREKLVALYDVDVGRMDAEIGRVLAALEKKSPASRTLVCFTADHGEELLDHGWVGHASTSGEAKLVEEVLRIPLVLAGPGVPAGGVAASLAQNVDVTPSLLELAGLPRSKSMQGVSLVKALAGGSPRKRLFFSTSVGGHLTPEERRAERLLGAGDGMLLHAERLGGPRRESDPFAPALAGDLARWSREQARARLRFLEAYGGAVRPSAEAVFRYAESLAVAAPADGARLLWKESEGTIRLAWNGTRHADSPFWVEYEVGSGVLSAKGAFAIEETSIGFGPFPVAFWNDLAQYSPFRFRILDPAAKMRSAWRAFRLERTGAVAP
ncbi:MAG TPA: sulfatase [Thermoanaerobaculia bacterium]|nr:sulfatase [Thermoanaerobaculia bacterium]